MIILGNNQDCYDYLANIFGHDNSKVLDRRDIISSENITYEKPPETNVKYKYLRYYSKVHYDSFNLYYLLIGNRKYLFHQVKNNVWVHHLFHKSNTDSVGNRLHKLSTEIEKKDLKNYVLYLETKENMSIRQPLSFKAYRGSRCFIGSIPILNTFNITSVISVEEIYSEIDMFLGWLIDNPCQIKEPSNDIKILSKGFDLKTSFRHPK